MQLSLIRSSPLFSLKHQIPVKEQTIFSRETVLRIFSSSRSRSWSLIFFPLSGNLEPKQSRFLCCRRIFSSSLSSGKFPQNSALPWSSPPPIVSEFLRGCCGSALITTNGGGGSSSATSLRSNLFQSRSSFLFFASMQNQKSPSHLRYKKKFSPFYFLFCGYSDFPTLFSFAGHVFGIFTFIHIIYFPDIW